MQAAANYIQSGHYQEAVNVLSGISDRTAQWYYYSAIANSGLGNQANALTHARQAASMEPGNAQYQNLVRQLESGGQWYGSMGSPFGGMPSMNGNSYCTRLCIAWTVCSCCFGGRGMYFCI